MPIYENLKQLNSKNFKKRIDFPILTETQPTIFGLIGLFTSLGVAFFRVTLHDLAEMFVKKATIYENDMTQFVFNFSTGIKCEEWEKKCDMKDISYFVWRLLQCKLSKKLTAQESDRTNTFVEN